jgi:aminoglycoside phosphotransferase (APT) family kinase protein
MDAHPSYDLNVLQDGQRMAQLIRQHLGVPMMGLVRIGRGFYSEVYRVSLDGRPDCIVKGFKFPGYAAQERAQLELLARHAPLKLPAVYAVHEQAPDLPFEALIMETIPGINASQIAFPDAATRERFADALVDNLLAWHAVRHPAGFGPIEGPFHETWLDFLGARIGAYQQAVHAPQHAGTVSAYVLRVIDRSFERRAEILAHCSAVASLIHGDYNLWNVMADPDTFEVTGVIDPIDGGWGDPEIDLFHLPNCRPDVGVLERYLDKVAVRQGFALRYAFYRFWDDVKHYLRVGWYEEGRFRGYAETLEAEMDRL